MFAALKAYPMDLLLGEDALLFFFGPTPNCGRTFTSVGVVHNEAVNEIMNDQLRGFVPLTVKYLLA